MHTSEHGGSMDSSCLWGLCDPASTEGTKEIETPPDPWPQLRACHTHCLLLRMDWSRLIITLQISPNSLLCLRVCKCVCSSCWHNTEAKRQVSLNHYVERVKIWGREVAGKRKMKQMRSDEWDVGCSVEVLMCASMSGGAKPQEKQGDEIQMRKNG